MGDIIYLRKVPLQEPFHQLNFVTVLLLHFPKFINVYTYDTYYLHTINLCINIQGIIYFKLNPQILIGYILIK